MQALKIFGVLIMVAVIATTAYLSPRFGTDEVKMTFQDYTRYAVPAFCAGALMLGIERLTSKMAYVKANKPPPKKEAPKDAPKAAPQKDAPKKDDKAAAGKDKKK